MGLKSAAIVGTQALLVRTLIAWAALLWFLGTPLEGTAQVSKGTTVSVSDFGVIADGVADDTAAFQQAFARAAQLVGSTVLIPPGHYYLSGVSPIRLGSNIRVDAKGARFRLPRQLNTRARVVFFSGENIQDFEWSGGAFGGSCFNPTAENNAWEPNVSTRIFVISTTATGRTERLRFSQIVAEDIAGAIVTVTGMQRAGSEREIANYAKSVVVEKCTFINCGQFMWDYGYLWQIVTWPEEHTALERSLAARYFPSELVHDGMSFEAGGTKVYVNNQGGRFKAGGDESPQHQITFTTARLPNNIVRGRAYFVVEAGSDYIKISDRARGAPLAYGSAQVSGVTAIRDLLAAYWQLYLPVGSADGKGAIDLRGCRDVEMRDCVISSRGDAMHVQRCRSNRIENNNILGARMGALFIAEYCQDTLVTGNVVNGELGSRVLSVEKSSERVVLRNNVFVGGGRGTWINQPTSITIEKNIFINNTRKGTQGAVEARRSPSTGKLESWAEIYFTLYEANGGYSDVIIRDNVFQAGIEAAETINFGANGRGILIENNVFSGRINSIYIHPSCTDITGRGNRGVIERWSAP